MKTRPTPETAHAHYLATMYSQWAQFMLACKDYAAASRFADNAISYWRKVKWMNN